MSQHSHLYNNRRWRAKRKAQLEREPLCRYCAQQGIVTPATVADHIKPHRGDVEAFWTNPLQSLCATHHSSAKAREDGGRGLVGCDADGWPT